MEFEGQYLTYEEYKGLGGTLDLMPFNILEYETRKQIDLRTQRRLVNETQIPQEVKMCEFVLIDKINGYAKATELENGNKLSENIDGYSVTYANPTQIKDIIDSKSAELEDIITTSLYGVIVNGEHILYIGAR